MTEEDIAIRVRSITKSFSIPIEPSSGIKQKLINTLKGRKGYREFTPLNNVSFDIRKGDFFGIIGRNGSGKSTLLKSIAGIYSPNKGTINVNGILVPFIELGVGFNPELSGRENVFLNGALLGFSHKEMEQMYDSIVEFAELTDFMDERLKNYSSGMQVRLAFSIAIRAKADILLLDEVLAVGDEAFQKKCLRVFEQYKADNKTVVIVTHDMSIVERFCTKAVLIHEGKIISQGDPEKISKEYSKLNSSTSNKNNLYRISKDDFEVKITKKDHTYKTGETAVISLKWSDDKVRYVGVTIMKRTGEYIFGTNTNIDNYSLKDRKKIDYHIDLNLHPGDYYTKVATFDKDMNIISFIEDGPEIVISDKTIHWGGLVKLNHRWKS